MHQFKINRLFLQSVKPGCLFFVLINLFFYKLSVGGQNGHPCPCLPQYERSKKRRVISKLAPANLPPPLLWLENAPLTKYHPSPTLFDLCTLGWGFCGCLPKSVLPLWTVDWTINSSTNNSRPRQRRAEQMELFMRTPYLQRIEWD